MIRLPQKTAENVCLYVPSHEMAFNCGQMRMSWQRNEPPETLGTAAGLLSA